ncbi:MAG: hypothetical protein R3F56_23100 [Planctomycetota bacterium]
MRRDRYSSATVTPSGAGRGIVCEPTVAFRGVDNPSSTVGFYTGNWFAALSTNSSSWSYVNPYQVQRHRRWLLLRPDLVVRAQPRRDGGTLRVGNSATTQRGSARVAFAVGGNIAANSWSSYVFTPQGLTGLPAVARLPGAWRSAATASSSRATSSTPRANAQNAVIWTMRLSEFVAGSGSVGWWFTTNIGGGGSVSSRAAPTTPSTAARTPATRACASSRSCRAA